MDEGGETMSHTITGKGKTVEEAVNQALTELGLTAEEVETNVVQAPESGVFGLFGKKEAIVEVTPIDNPEKKAQEFLTDLLGAMGIQCVIEAKLAEDILNIELTGKDMGILIGRRGQTLDSIQYLTSLVVNKKSDQYVRVIIDTENYRSKRQKTLENLAHKMAAKVVHYHKKMSLEPMNPAERRVIHATLQDDDKVYTYSEGDDPYRHVVIDLQENH